MGDDMLFINRLLQEFDHEISLLSAAAFLILFLRLAAHAVQWSIGKLVLPFVGITGRRSPSSSTSSQGARMTTILLLLMALDIPSWLLEKNTSRDGGLADLIQGRDPRLQEILKRVPLIQQGPSPPFWLRNRHIQFLPWLIQNEIHRQEGIPFQRIPMQVMDCLDKQASSSFSGCHEGRGIMTDTITLDIFPPFADDKHSDFGQNFNQSSPIILFCPGLRSNSQDLPGNMIIRKAYEQGFRSIVVNRRGHTPNQPLQSPRWNLFGDVDDLEQVYWYIQNELLAPDAPMFLHGISSGTALTVTALTEWDRRRREDPTRPVPVIVSSVAITPGYDISKVFHRERFQFPYHDLLMGGVKDHFVKQNEALLRSHNSDAVDQILAATNLQEFLNAAVPFTGYDNTTLYYQYTNPINQLRDISTPKLVLNAIDDPCCRISNLYENSPYPSHGGKNFAEMISESENAIVAVTWTGSHCPFLCTRSGDNWGWWSSWLPLLPMNRDPLNGGWMLHSWADQVSIDYYVATLHVYGNGQRRKL